jgi:hypothetical protein
MDPANTRFEHYNDGFVELPITQLAPAVMTPEAFHDGLWRGYLKAVMDLWLRRAAYRQVLDDYLRFADSDGRESGAWTASATRLMFGFTTAAGLCAMSAAAASHWTMVALAAVTGGLRRDFDYWARPAGYVVAPQPPLDALLAGGWSRPLVELRRRLYYVDRGAPPALVSDDGIPALPLDALRPAERARVDDIARTGRCACQLCEGLRRSDGPPRIRVLRAPPSYTVPE